jgi:hypothetical protein
MSKFGDSLITLDDQSCVRRYKYSNRLEELKAYQESELIERAHLSLKKYQNEINSHIAMSDTEIYIGSKFFQNYTTALV